MDDDELIIDGATQIELDAVSACSARTCALRERVDPIGIAFIAVPVYKNAPLCPTQRMMLR